MRTTINIPDHLFKKAKIKAVEEGISLKELFTRCLENELSEMDSTGQLTPWEALKGKGSAQKLSPDDSGFEGCTGPDWNHSVQVNEPE